MGDQGRAVGRSATGVREASISNEEHEYINAWARFGPGRLVERLGASGWIARTAKGSFTVLFATRRDACEMVNRHIEAIGLRRSEA